ncbi:vWA domain-containing protein [Rhodopseudomonas sp. RCAM05734]|uniref:vWA domain-containing protein n=1 Tax=Rhodopseudomonas sp. RCAM05734 TaxID=3457549 RepID=UPI0040451768
MLHTVIASRILPPLRRFCRSQDGNIAVIFAIVMVPTIGFIGAAVDYSRANAARSAMHAALDSAALMVAKDDAAGDMTRAQLNTKANAYFTALYTNTDVPSVTLTATYSNSATTGSSVVLSGSGTINTSFMKVVGFPTLTLSSSSTASWGMTKLRVAMALDNTGSMKDDGKMSALQTATTNLINQLSASAQTNGDVYISLVPFANVVNLGTGYKNSGYIDWSNWSTVGSIEEGWTCGSSYNSWYRTMRCGSSSNNINSWNGCVIDRTQNYDVQITAPTTAATYYPADQSSYCPTVITPLSYNWTALKASVATMTPSGGTNQPIGLVWAWQTLQQTAPFNAPAEDSNYTYKKAIILLSDGLNTMDRWYGDGSTPSSQVDARQQPLCDNIKAANVTIYTIQVNTGGDPTSAVLQYCASGSGNFFQLTTASQVISTFNTIGTALTNLRISK